MLKLYSTNQLSEVPIFTTSPKLEDWNNTTSIERGHEDTLRSNLRLLLCE